MKTKQKKGNGTLDYTIGVLMITILILATFLMPQAYSTLLDSKDLNQVHAVLREDFSFDKLVEMTVYERTQQIMEVLKTKNKVNSTLSLSGSEAMDSELVDGVREAIGIAVNYKLMPDITAYDIANNIIYAEYYNLSDSTTESAETAFWSLRFSDYQTFDFTLRVDASEYIIYQAELYCAEVKEYMNQITSDDKDAVDFLNNEFMEGCGSYFEAEGYSSLTDTTYGELVFMMGYERDEYAVYHAPCENGYVSGQGIRWGFVPMTVALEGGAATKEWGYKGIVAYYEELFGIDIR